MNYISRNIALLLAIMFSITLLPLSGQTYKIVDTGQEKCYDDSKPTAAPAKGAAFYGQDAQIDGNQPSYKISEDGLTVYDSVTGLTWTKTGDWNDDGTIDYDDKFLFPDFLAYADTLNAENYGGFSDWRAPTIKELYSLIDFKGTDPITSSSDYSGLIPFIDTLYFDFAYGDTDAGDRIIDAQNWSSTEYVSTTMGGLATTFGVNFADGRIKGYGRTDQYGQEILQQFGRFVRGNTDYGINDFIENGDSTITDNATGLMWTQYDNGTGINWEDALAWAQEKNEQNYLGYSDWRLPNTKELQSIVDYTRSPSTTSSPAIDSIFTLTQIINEADEEDYPFYWTGTTHARLSGAGTAAAYICFGRGIGSMDGETAIDVHGAGCQRSDPKDGDESDYPILSDSPQGDAERVFNYVLLTRDAGKINGVNDDENEIPSSFMLNQNYPNPFNPSTTISFSLSSNEYVSLEIYNILGERVASLVHSTLSAGSHSYQWKASNFSSGIYFYTLRAGAFTETKKMILMK